MGDDLKIFHDAIANHVGAWVVGIGALIAGWPRLREGLLLAFRDVIRVSRLDRIIPALRQRSQEEREREMRFRDIAENIHDTLVVLNIAERWNDRHFTELEAEIEASETPFSRFTIVRAFRRRRIRRERSLSSALARSRARLAFLQGAPGSGKTVALKHLALELSERAASDPYRSAPIPLYISLRTLEPQGRAVDVELIEKFVRKRIKRLVSGDARLLRNELARGNAEGRWIYLFDSFDEIPDILRATDASSTIQAYSRAIMGFLASTPPCRGVIASRQFRAPRGGNWPIFTIQPLNEARKRTLIGKYLAGTGKSSMLLDGLHEAGAGIVEMATNPFLLRLLCEYVETNPMLPSAPHSVFEDYVTKRLDSVDQEDEDQSDFVQLDGPDLRPFAEALAFAMTARNELGLEPTLGQLTEAGIGAQLEIGLQSLINTKLGRMTEDEPGGPRRFAFYHRRFQEYFATCVVLRHRDRVSVEELLTNGRWRETSVVLLQTQQITDSEPLVVEAERMLGLATASVGPLLVDPSSRDRRPFSWPEGIWNVLSILQQGSPGDTSRSRQASRMPPRRFFGIRSKLAVSTTSGGRWKCAARQATWRSVR